jgi:hypothetical protein
MIVVRLRRLPGYAAGDLPGDHSGFFTPPAAFAQKQREVLDFA